MAGQELEAREVAYMLQHLYCISSYERRFCPLCDARLQIHNHNLYGKTSSRYYHNNPNLSGDTIICSISIYVEVKQIPLPRCIIILDESYSAVRINN